MFNRTYDYIKDALLWTDTITTFYFLDKISVDATREHMLSFKKEPVKIDKYMDRLASFPTNLRFVAKKMALYFQNNGISLSSIIKPGFNPIINPIIEVVIIAVLHYFLIETEYEDIFERISTQVWIGPTKDNGEHFFVFFKLIDQVNLPGSQITWLDNYHDRKPYYRSILKAAEQLSTMIGLSGFLKPDSSQFDQMPSERRQELIDLLQDTSKKVRIYAKIEDGSESSPSKEVMSMIGSRDEPLALSNAKAIEIIRSKIAASRHSRRGGKRRKSSNHTQRRKKNGKRFKRTMKH